MSAERNPGERQRVRRRAAWGSPMLAVAVFVIICCTRGYFLGDTMSYSGDIFRSLDRSPFGAGSQLWEFGHVLWRPLGWALTRIGGSLFSRFTDWSPREAAVFVLIAISMIAGCVTVLLWRSLALEITGSRVVSFLVALAFACSNSFLTFLHSGASYLPGLLCVTLGLWVLRRPTGEGAAGRGAISCSAVLGAVAALFWLPYVFSIPGMIFWAIAPARLPANVRGALRREQVKRAILFTVVFAIVLLAVLGAAGWAHGIGSAAEARAWAADSSHGWSQTIRAARLATGLPRAFFYLAKDGLLYKRFLLRDPYAPVTLMDLVRASLWKIALFYCFLACLIYELFRDFQSRRLFLALLAGSVPTLAFAIFVFEPGSPERYFPAYPFLILAAAWALRDFRRARRAGQWMIAAFLVCMSVTSVYCMFRPRIDREDAGSLVRLEGLPRPARGALVAVVSNQDALYRTSTRLLFNRDAAIPMDDVIGAATDQILTWRRDFSRSALDAWSQGKDVWASKRFWAVRPLPEWNWAEGDDERIKWKELPEFFLPLETDGECGGLDGFSKLKPGEANLQRLGAFVNPKECAGEARQRSVAAPRLHYPQ
jgi:hypothetical protein